MLYIKTFGQGCILRWYFVMLVNICNIRMSHLKVPVWCGMTTRHLLILLLTHCKHTGKYLNMRLNFTHQMMNL